MRSSKVVIARVLWIVGMAILLGLSIALIHHYWEAIAAGVAFLLHMILGRLPAVQQENTMDLGPLTAAVGDLEVRANPVDQAAEQSAVDALTTRVTAVADRFPAPEPPPAPSAE